MRKARKRRKTTSVGQRRPPGPIADGRIFFRERLQITGDITLAREKGSEVQSKESLQEAVAQPPSQSSGWATIPVVGFLVVVLVGMVMVFGYYLSARTRFGDFSLTRQPVRAGNVPPNPPE